MAAKASGPIDRQIDAYNRRDVDALIACYSPDVVIEDASSGEVLMRGHEEMRRAYCDLFAASPRLRAEVAARIELGDYVVDEEHVVGMRGASDVVRVVAIYRVAHGLIAGVRYLFDRSA